MGTTAETLTCRVVVVVIRSSDGQKDRLICYAVTMVLNWTGEILLHVAAPLLEGTVGVHTGLMALHVGFFF
jgi:hypothetical protein